MKVELRDVGKFEKIPSIRKFRELTGWGLKESKQIIDIVMEGNKQEFEVNYVTKADINRILEGMNYEILDENGKAYDEKFASLAIELIRDRHITEAIKVLEAMESYNR